MAVLSSPDFDGHELVSFHQDEETGLRAIVAVHQLYLGRACGGTRMRAYSNEDEAVRDVLRLSGAMSRKAALANVPMGGAKSVIIGDPNVDKSDSLLRAMGRLVARFEGSYIAAPDVGISQDDLRSVRVETPWVAGVDYAAAPFTARGVFVSIRAAVQRKLNQDSLEGVSVAVQGVGSVGSELCRLLAAEGAILSVADTNEGAVKRLADELGAQMVSPEEVLRAKVDVLSPCALGGVIDGITATEIQAKIIVGAANNQLVANEHGRILFERGILFAPDYLVSAGGLIAGAAEIDGFDLSAVEKSIDGIGGNLTELFELSASKSIPEIEAAELLAQERMRQRRSLAT